MYAGVGMGRWAVQGVPRSPGRAAPLGGVGGAPGPRLRFGPGGSQGVGCVSQAHSLPAEQKEQAAAAPSLRLTQRKRTATASLVTSLREEGRRGGGGAGEQGSGGGGGWVLLLGRLVSWAVQPAAWAGVALLALCPQCGRSNVRWFLFRRFLVFRVILHCYLM